MWTWYISLGISSAVVIKYDQRGVKTHHTDSEASGIHSPTPVRFMTDEPDYCVNAYLRLSIFLRLNCSPVRWAFRGLGVKSRPLDTHLGYHNQQRQ